MIAKHVSRIVAVFFAAVVALVFQQIATSMSEQGIASGGPYDNAAAYPRAVAVSIAALVLLQLVIERFTGAHEPDPVPSDALRRACGLLIVFALYLGVLSRLGYHLTTTPLVLAIMWICGGRNIGKLLPAALLIAFVFAFVFEKFLNVVLPGGMFGLNIPW